MKYCSKLLIVVLVAGLINTLQGQTTIRLMSLNLLNYPSPEPPNRLDTLEKIVGYYQPDLLMVQELLTSSALGQMTDMIDDLGYGSFAQSEFEPNQSNPVDDHHQAIVYNLDLLRLRSQDEIVTEVRDINEFVLYLNDPELENGADTTFLYVYVAHLKSAAGAVNENARLDMVNEWLAHVEDAVPEGSRVILAGDFNLYNNQEPAYLALTNNNSPLPLRDVFASYGNWTGSGFPHKEILTQSTRVTQLFGDGAGGGLDDRFDFILFSDALMNDNNPLHYAAGSYHSLGNNGTCYNQNITNCDTGNEVPDDVLRAIYYMSDHIPQTCELTTSVGVHIDHESNVTLPDIQLISSADNELRIMARLPHPDVLHLEIIDALGRVVDDWTWSVNGGRNTLNHPLYAGFGIYFLKVSNNTGASVVLRFSGK